MIGVDCFTDYYPRPMKERNLAELRRSDRFRFVEADLRFFDEEGLRAQVAWQRTRGG